MSDPQSHCSDAPEGTIGIDTAEHLAGHLAQVLTPQSVIVCVGNEMCGDDGAGVAVAQHLSGRVPWTLFDTQNVPESFLMKIVECKPGTVVLVDALDFAAPPGSVELFEADRIGGQGPSTHGPAPLAFLELLAMFHPCRQAVLGIQPRQTDFGQPMSKCVRYAAKMVAHAFTILAGQE